MQKQHHMSETPTQPASTKPTGGRSVTSGAEEQVQKGNAKSQVVRVRAYQKWEAAGKPNGDGVNFWIEAEQELLQAK